MDNSQTSFQIQIIPQPNGQTILQVGIINGPSQFLLLMPPEGAEQFAQALLQATKQAGTGIIIPKNGEAPISNIEDITKRLKGEQ